MLVRRIVLGLWSGTPLKVQCQVVQDVVEGGEYVRCMQPMSGSVTAFSTGTLLAEYAQAQ